jgi:sulfite reductase (NADPH) hemoprotein beta-component
MFIENGRVQDEPGREFKTGLREIAKVHKGTFRLTANQHLLVSDIASADLLLIKSLLSKYKLDNLSYTGLRLSSSACVAFPTCGLAMAESERVRVTVSRPSPTDKLFLLRSVSATPH